MQWHSNKPAGPSKPPSTLAKHLKHQFTGEHCQYLPSQHQSRLHLSSFQEWISWRHRALITLTLFTASDRWVKAPPYASFHFKTPKRTTGFKCNNENKITQNKLHNYNHKYTAGGKAAYISELYFCLNILVHSGIHILLYKTGNSNGDIDNTLVKYNHLKFLYVYCMSVNCSAMAYPKQREECICLFGIIHFVAYNSKLTWVFRA